MTVLLLSSLLALAGPAAPEPESDPTTARVDAMEKENNKLRKRVEALEEASASDDEAAKNAEAEREAARKEELAELERQNETLGEEVQELRERQERSEEQLEKQKFLTSRFHGYLDVGFFSVTGDGSGIRPDLGYATTGLDDVAPDVWVFLGDPLSTAINSRGDVADAGDSQAVAFDPIASNGNPTFIVNAFNVAPSIGLGERFAVEGMVDFLPRGRTVASYGETALSDYVDIKLAYVRWTPKLESFGLSLYAGKVDSVFGREYRYQEAPDRMTVTPSLMCRYTCGRPIGLKSRWTFLRERQLAFNISLTNGNTMQRSFGTASEREHNVIKTVAGRLSYEFPVGAGLDIGVSGLGGAQDLQPSNDVFQWQYGVDAHLDIRGFELTAEFLQGKMQGKDRPSQACAVAQCLDAMSAYGVVGYRIANWVMPYFRTDWRDSRHVLAQQFYYESELVRFTPGIRFEVGEHVIMKAEYTFNRELGRIPQFPNDVFTSSVVARF